ncbi:molybdopterin dinucleotide binding domain-containing protein [Streptomyces canus]|uniref:molybdopterin dinucleotide binding domain-containing protein n=1 Tax=Streptomyces canus TaxID=58343 RepID=UPI0027D86135|nr:molybdopterin dinucleotide binding domain-containing protein [Streptomyces canus]
MLAGRSGVTFTEDEYEDAWQYVPHADQRIPLPIPELLDLIDALDKTPSVHTTPEFPFVLAAGQRRAFTANVIFRDTTWRKLDAGGALRISPHDAERLGLADGAAARITTRRGTARATFLVSTLMTGWPASRCSQACSLR